MGLLIIGHHRSGTTVLTGICNGHPDITLLNEAGWYMALDQPFKKHAQYVLARWLKKRNFPLIQPRYRAVRKIKGVDFIRNFLLTSRYLGNLLAQSRAEPIITAYDVTGALRGIFPRAHLVGDKYPDYWFKLDSLAQKSDLRCVAIYRDPRDTANSVLIKSRGVWKNYWPAELQNAAVFAQRWVRLVEAIERNQETIHAIRYEDFVTDPQAVLQRLGAFLNVDPGGFAYTRVHTGSIGKYKEGLSNTEVLEIMDIAGESMQRIGYKI